MLQMDQIDIYLHFKLILLELAEGLVNMKDNENAEFKIFHCMQLLHHAYNHCFAKDTITCIYTTKHASKTLFILTFQPHQAFK